MDRYYGKKRGRSRSPVSRNRATSSSNLNALPEFIPLVSSTQPHSEVPRRSRNSRDQRHSPHKDNGHEPMPKQKQRRRISPPTSRDEPLTNRRNIYRSRSRSQEHSSVRSQISNSNRSRTNSSERTNRSVFYRLGANEKQRNHSPIRFGNDPQILSPAYSQELLYPTEPFLNGRQPEYRDNNLDPVRIVVRNNNYQGGGNAADGGFNSNRHVIANDIQAEIMYSIRHLEQQNRDNLRHINGVKTTVENYQREIYKLETIVHNATQEIEKLKNHLNFLQ